MKSDGSETINNVKIIHVHLGRFIILRFSFIMVFIYILSNLMEFPIQKLAQDLLIDKMHMNEIAFTELDMLGRIKLLVAAMIQIFPAKFSGILQSIIYTPLLNSLNIQYLAPDEIMEKGTAAVSLYYLLVLLIIILLLILSLLPYLAGGIIFTGLIKKKMNELREYDRKRTEDYEKRRNLLLSDIAHDIKTPITAMSGYAKALSDGLVPDEKKDEYLNTIYLKSMRVSELINIFFEYIKMDSAGYRLDIAEGDLAETIREVVAVLYPDFEDAGIELDIEIPDEVCLYNMDKIQMSRVVTNLLTNSIKYIDKGNKVRISMKEEKGSLARAGEHAWKYEILVEDTGAQIDDDLAENIFTPFTRGDKTRSTKGGTGLGLSIAHKIVELHGGELLLDRNLTDGYTKAFVIRL